MIVVIIIIAGIILSITVIGAVIGIPILVNGIVLFAMGATYRAVRDIQKKPK